MRGRELTRRQILAGVAGAGGTGILVGTGTAAFLADDEAFGNAYVVGAVDFDVDWSGGTAENGTATVEIDAPTGSETLRVRLEDLEDKENNPAYVWLRLTCPGETDLACALEVSLSYVCADGSTRQIAPSDGSEYAPLLDVANELRTGTPLSPTCDSSARRCLRSGETIELRFEWRLTESYSGGRTTLAGAEDLFKFEGEQCRYNSGANPFGVGAGTCGTCVQEVSWITFCAEAPDDGAATDPDPTDATELIDSGTAVDWETENDVDYVVLKTGLGGENDPYIVYDYRSVTKTDGVARVGDERADFRGTRSGDGEFGGCRGNSNKPPDACPCQYAKDVMVDGSNGAFDGTSTKLEEEGGALQEVN